MGVGSWVRTTRVRIRVNASLVSTRTIRGIIRLRSVGVTDTGGALRNAGRDSLAVRVCHASGTNQRALETPYKRTADGGSDAGAVAHACNRLLTDSGEKFTGTLGLLDFPTEHLAMDAVQPVEHTGCTPSTDHESRKDGQ